MNGISYRLDTGGHTNIVIVMNEFYNFANGLSNELDNFPREFSTVFRLNTAQIQYEYRQALLDAREDFYWAVLDYLNTYGEE